jgi:large subunit ribosomal protein L19
MDQKIVELISKGQIKNRPDVKVGDTVKLSMKIKEAGKERIQLFEGVVISMSGSGLNKTITVRKISYGIGIERIIPMHTPTLDKIEIVKRGKVRRAKLFYMRNKIGKRALDVSHSTGVYMTDGEDVVESTEDAPVVEEAVVENMEVIEAATPAEEVTEVKS